MKSVAIYARVSTDGQTTENQLRELQAVADRHGWKAVAQYVDNGISGAKGREARPEYDRMLKAAARREFDLIMSWSVDRLGRSMSHLVSFLEEIRAKGVDLYLHVQALDTSTPAGRAMFQMCGVFAEFERSMIQSRVKAGLERAKARGKTLGRPKASAAKESAILAARSEGKGIRKIARELGIGVSVVQRVLTEAHSS